MKTISHIIYVAFALFTLACFALLQNAQAVVPPPDGGYAGGNTAEGTQALFSLTTGANNTALGYQAMYFNTTGNLNTASGWSALLSNTEGSENTATGWNALRSNTTGTNNTATGVLALFSNTTGRANTATGEGALFSNTTGFDNTATGLNALLSNTEGIGNTADGLGALNANTTGGANTATGSEALFSNTEGIENTATGEGALFSNTTGLDNTATGLNALFNTTGSSNIAAGAGPGSNLTTGDDNIDIGNLGVAAESNTIRIGTQGTQMRTFIAGIFGKTSSGGTPVYINSNGKLGTSTSSKRFKEDIEPMDKASEAVLALKPVTFRYKAAIDQDRIPQFGLIAEEVEKVNPDLVVRDTEGKPYTVRYDAVNAMLLNEFLKEHRKVEEQSRKIQEQDATITQFKKEMQTIAACLKEQDSKIQRVSARLGLQGAPSRTVANSQ
jgi:hypothetical protein